MESHRRKENLVLRSCGFGGRRHVRPILMGPRTFIKSFFLISVNFFFHCSVIQIKADGFCANVDTVRQDLVYTFSGTGLSLKCRKDIADHAEKMDEILSETETACGVRFEVEVDYNGLMTSITRRDLDDSLGEFVYTYVRSLCNSINNSCQTDDLNKEAIQESCATKKIKFQVYKDRKEYDKVQKDTNNYGRGRIVNGDLVIELHNESLYANVDYFLNFDKTFSGV